jgi:S-adenosylmethionine-diacylglycerol 3-amino-3-carboxypropyl transferase
MARWRRPATWRACCASASNASPAPSASARTTSLGRRSGALTPTRTSGGPLPPYLRRDNFAAIRARADRVEVFNRSFTEYLETQPDASLDRYVLLDAQDWMNDAQLNALWREITRTAKPGARAIFRTAAEPSLLPGRIDDAILDRWRYQAEQSRTLTQRDRSAIYGGFHLYVLDA